MAVLRTDNRHDQGERVLAEGIQAALAVERMTTARNVAATCAALASVPVVVALEWPSWMPPEAVPLVEAAWLMGLAGMALCSLARLLWAHVLRRAERELGGI